MEINEYRNIYENEKEHFFYVSTHQLITSLLKDYLKNRKTKNRLKILDAGCGTGLLASKLQKFGQVVGVDISPEALRFAKTRGINVKQASIDNLPFKANNFDLVVSIDVLTHKSIKNDIKALKEFYTVLKPGGILILRVSANNWLTTVHDKQVHMRERYERDVLRQKLATAGFLIEKLSFINAILLLPAAIRHFWEKLSPPKTLISAIIPIPTFINKTLIFLLAIEEWIIFHGNLPFGIGFIAVCRKPKR